MNLQIKRYFTLFRVKKSKSYKIKDLGNVNYEANREKYHSKIISRKKLYHNILRIRLLELLDILVKLFIKLLELLDILVKLFIKLVELLGLLVKLLIKLVGLLGLLVKLLIELVELLGLLELELLIKFIENWFL